MHLTSLSEDESERLASCVSPASASAPSMDCLWRPLPKFDRRFMAAGSGSVKTSCGSGEPARPLADDAAIWAPKLDSDPPSTFRGTAPPGNLS
jgi:hypothetical protein